MHKIPIRGFYIGDQEPLTIITGPCVIESEEHALSSAQALVTLFEKHPYVHFIYKSSYDKANRSSVHSFRGPGLEKGLRILEKIKKTFDIPVTSDIHLPDEANAVKDVLDIIQIPAFLCRQTDLILAAAKTKKPIHVKKGQFLSPWDMKNVVEKIESQNNQLILLGDRGTSFGYNNLVTDLRAIPVMQNLGYPVCFDATHSVQLPGALGTASGGKPEFTPILAKASIAAGANALYMESHPNPPEAKSDKATVLSFNVLDKLLNTFQRIHKAVQS